MEAQPEQFCPVCKSDINEQKMTPIYGYGTSEIDPRKDRPRKECSSNTKKTFAEIGINVNLDD